MNSDHRFFNPNIINSFRSTLKNIHKIEESTSARNLAQWRERRAREREEAAQKSAEYKERSAARKQGRAELQAELDAQIAKNMAGGMDKYKARKAVLDAWAQDPEKQKRSQELGLGRVGRKGGGMVGWNFENQKAADESKKRGEAQLAAWRAEDAARRANEPEPTPEPRPRPGPGQVGGPGGYIDPNSPAGRVFGQIQRGELPPDVLDTTRDSHGRVVDAVNASPNPRKQGENLRVPETELRGPRTPTPSVPTQPPKPAPSSNVPPENTPDSDDDLNYNETISSARPPSTAQLAADFMTARSRKSTPTVRRMPIIPQSRVV